MTSVVPPPMPVPYKPATVSKAVPSGSACGSPCRFVIQVSSPVTTGSRLVIKLPPVAPVPLGIPFLRQGNEEEQAITGYANTLVIDYYQVDSSSFSEIAAALAPLISKQDLAMGQFTRRVILTAEKRKNPDFRMEKGFWKTFQGDNLVQKLTTALSIVFGSIDKFEKLKEFHPFNCHVGANTLVSPVEPNEDWILMDLNDFGLVRYWNGESRCWDDADDDCIM